MQHFVGVIHEVFTGSKRPQLSDDGLPLGVALSLWKQHLVAYSTKFSTHEITDGQSDPALNTRNPHKQAARSYAQLHRQLVQ
jgi:hypothetical protein